VTPIDPRLLAVARARLPGAPPPPRDGWAAHLESVVSTGLAGLFSSSAAAGLIDIDAPMATRLQQQLYSEAVRAVQLEGELVRLSPAFEHLGAVVLKGPVLAHGAYLDPILRPFTDLDLLVAGHRVPEAIELFTTYGYQRTRPEPAPGFDTRVGKATMLEHPGGVVIDLHRTLVAGNLGEGIDVEELLAARRDVRVGANTVPAPSWEAHLVECSLHAVVGDGLARPLSLRDIAEVVHHPSLDAGEAADMAVRWQVWEPVACGLRAARESLCIELPDDLAVLADQGADVAPAPAPVRSPRSRLDELRGGDLRRRRTLARSLVAPSAEFPAPPLHHSNAGPAPSAQQSNGGPASLAHLDALEPAPPPVGATAPELASPAATVPTPPTPPALPSPTTSPLTTVGFTERSAPAPLPTVARRAAGANHAGGVSGGRQAAWTQARPPRQGTARTGSRQATSRAREGPSDDDGDSDGDGTWPPASDPDPTRGTGDAPPAANGLALGFAGGGLLAITAISSQLGNNSAGLVLVPLGSLLLAGAASRRIARRHPDEAWVGRLLVLGVLVKLTASYLRYQTAVGGYGGVADAVDYDDFGRRFAAAWLNGSSAPELADLRQHNFIRWFTGHVYYMFGSNMVAGFFVFGLLALVGSYLWYRATVDTIPGVDKRLYLGLVLFVPSIAFWPSSIGKEALMQLSIGMIALATAHALNLRLARGLVLGAAGGWVLWMVRPHLLALVTVAAGFAYLAGRVRASDHGVRSLVGRPVGLIVIAFLMALTVTQGAEFLGIEDLSLSSIEAELDEQTERSAQGDSRFDNGGNSLNPIYLPQRATTVLLRPFPWETDSSLQLLSSLESTLLAVLIVSRLPSLGSALARARSSPFLLFCWVLVTLYAASFSSFANFGLLVRQRSLVLPALFALVAVRTAARPRSSVPTPAVVTGGARAVS
jgi:hypothetical protein